MNDTYVFAVTDEMAGERLDKALTKLLEGTSRSFLQKRISEGLVLVDGKSVKGSYKLSEGEEISLTIPPAEAPDIPAQDIPLDILYEDEDVLIVNKPKGMVVHPAAGHYTDTLVNAVMFHCGDSLSGINGVMRPGIVHRIDMDTSGSVIICKNDFAHNSIAEQLKAHSIDRVYIAICMGHLPEEQTVDAPIGRSPADRKKMAVVPGGKRAVTHIRLLKELPGMSVVECRLETGRTHQIRVHLSSVGHPLLGDTVYGGPASYRSPEGRTIPLEGQCLHAMTLGFTHPRTGERITVNAPLPQYFLEIAGALEL